MNKPICVVIFITILCLLLSGCISDYVLSEDCCNYEDCFNPSDLNFIGFAIWDDLETLLCIMGEPNEIIDEIDESYNESYYSYHYDFGFVIMSGDGEGFYYVNRIYIDLEDFIGPRETKIGDNYTDVIKKFRCESTFYNDHNNNVKYLYQDINI